MQISKFKLFENYGSFCFHVILKIKCFNDEKEIEAVSIYTVGKFDLNLKNYIASPK